MQKPSNLEELIAMYEDDKNVVEASARDSLSAYKNIEFTNRVSLPQKMLHKLSITNSKPAGGVARRRGTVLLPQNNNQQVSQKDMKDNIYYDKLLF